MAEGTFASHVAKGDAHARAGEMRAAGAWYAAALKAAQAGEPASPGEVQRIGGEMQRIQAGFARHLVESLATDGFPQADWHPRFRKALAIMTGQARREDTGQKFLPQPTAYFHPDLPYAQFHSADRFAWAEAILAETEAIRVEAEALLGREGTFGAYVRKTDARPQGDVHGMLDNTDWSTFDLTDKGKPVRERVELCPVTWRTIVQNAPLCDIPNRAPSVMFSLLRAGSRIPPHEGMINARLICHLPLIVPGNGALRVGEEVREWRTGELLVFDDSIEHEAWNNAERDRLVLIFDIWHPDLAAEERAQISALFAAVDSY